MGNGIERGEKLLLALNISPLSSLLEQFRVGWELCLSNKGKENAWILGRALPICWVLKILFLWLDKLGIM
jgi:uncharacterized membrane protein